MDKPQTEKFQKNLGSIKASDLTLAELRQFILDVIDERFFEWEQNLPDPDEGLEFKPEVAERLKKNLETPIKEIPTISHEEMLRELGLDE